MLKIPSLHLLNYRKNGRAPNRQSDYKTRLAAPLLRQYLTFYSRYLNPLIIRPLNYTIIWLYIFSTKFLSGSGHISVFIASSEETATKNIMIIIIYLITVVKPEIHPLFGPNLNK